VLHTRGGRDGRTGRRYGFGLCWREDGSETWCSNYALPQDR
jgi:hypothetical protein